MNRLANATPPQRAAEFLSPKRLQEDEQLIEAALNRFGGGVLGSKTDKPVEVWRALQFIHGHLFDEELTVSLVRAHCRFSNHNISIQFKRVMGVGMRQYIAGHRIEAAMYLLEHAPVSIQRIGWAVGYSHPESFNRAFKRYTGYAPARFRKRLWSQQGIGEVPGAASTRQPETGPEPVRGPEAPAARPRVPKGPGRKSTRSSQA